jgi:membrane protein required for colicin V production|tara:strand:+ start:1687 stop:2229 length:543 start_codon:yes stop_codon:yes gene_type:complete
MDAFLDLFKNVSSFDLSYLVITILSLVRCTKKGFVLSILSASKWILAYVITLILFPKVKPFVNDIIDNEYVLDIILGVSIFTIIIFIILFTNKAVSKAITYTGLGSLDKTFGFIFGFIWAYIIAVCVFTTVDIVYNHDKWPIKQKGSLTYEWVENGSNYLIKVFPDKEQYENTKDKVQEL